MMGQELSAFLAGTQPALDTTKWLRDCMMPVIIGALNANDRRCRLALYGGERIPENERNLTDVRNRVSLITEYEFARTLNDEIKTAGVADLFVSYVVANRFPDLETRLTDGQKGLRFEVKCVQSIAEEPSANFETLRKDIHPRTDFLVVFLWEWDYAPCGANWDRSPLILEAYVFHAASLAALRDCYWLNRPPTDLGNGYQGFDLRYAVNCRNGDYNVEEGNYGKLLRMWQPGFAYSPPGGDLLDLTRADYLHFKESIVDLGFDSLAHRMLPALSGGLQPSRVDHEGAGRIWKAGVVAFVLQPPVGSRNAFLSALGAEEVYTFTKSFKWTRYSISADTVIKLPGGAKPKHIIRDQDGS